MFERYLSLWVVLCMGVGVLLGKVIPGFTDGIRVRRDDHDGSRQTARGTGAPLVDLRGEGGRVAGAGQRRGQAAEPRSLRFTSRQAPDHESGVERTGDERRRRERGTPVRVYARRLL